MLTGGYEPAERKIVCFLPSYEEETMEPPIRILEVKPVSPRFAEALTHRDYLGALMNLGIERSMLGDIVINEDGCFIFCLDRMAEYISNEIEAGKAYGCFLPARLRPVLPGGTEIRGSSGEYCLSQA